MEVVLEDLLFDKGGFSYNAYLNKLNPKYGYMVSF